MFIKPRTVFPELWLNFDTRFSHLSEEVLEKWNYKLTAILTHKVWYECVDHETPDIQLAKLLSSHCLHQQMALI